ncbi:MAG: ribose-5-phosphate isomerase [Candidatus Levybacteria bacterium RIFCSPLOWO2_12_FULL_37_14]|nr:MAG: Ribose 5-phosphate isomerase [Candidatus Levybacteria bacterium GW2011_GWA1_37_16]KKQ38557.1 MAG: Ribose 5-phosphate isomerase [Candidatus Levybacteria bacterium GW2011_GWC2_37_7]KKQ40775.1 MAG: Ribose 5-phosphate isomerase [Candidatus Levybacteria bacterium GW2011_GWB1_37_8]OGH50194.1 MAG: ribose-5-phosphate isomerase [Candidatus Levybacteria bacterium RIFCSPLOWO2_12_FULL_37_14]
MKIYLGTDHAGFELKEKIKSFLLEKSFDIEDCGAFTFDKNDDYPDFISKAAIKVSQNSSSFGIVFGKSGAGECITANKIKGIRAILGFSVENVKLAREHNDANVLSFGSAFVDEEVTKNLLTIFLETKFTNEERHIRRINKITEIENLWH